MHGIAIAFLGFAFATDPIELPADVYEIRTREFVLPILTDPDRRKNFVRLRVFVSEDRGKTWKLFADCKPTEDSVRFTASKDGEHWFALQIETKDGKRDPADVTELTPGQKVYVNSERKTVKAMKAEKSYQELQREVEDLKNTIERLEKRIKELEGGRNP